MFNFIFNSLFLENQSFSIFDDIGKLLFRSIGTVFKIGLVAMISGLLKLAEAIYSVFEVLAKATNIFNKEIYEGITDRIFSIFGVIVLFIAAYNFLMYVIDPEKNSGDMSIEKMLKNIVKVFIIIILLPTIFNFANGLFGSIVENDVIGKIILGDTGDSCDDWYKKNICDNDGVLCQKIIDGVKSKRNGMTDSLVSILEGFFVYNGTSETEVYNIDDYDVYFPSIVCYNGRGWGKSGKGSACTLSDTATYAKCMDDFSALNIFGANWGFDSDDTHTNTYKYRDIRSSSAEDIKDDHDYNKFKFEFLIGLFTVIFVIYILISFCFDLAVRAIKLAFYQIVAPLCVGCAILPGPKKEIYTKWKSLTIKTYASVLVRILAMDLGVLFITSLSGIMARLKSNITANCGAFCQMLVYVFLILGILTFVKQLPKIIDELIGEESGLAGSVREKFKQSGGLAIAASASAAVVGAGRGVINAGKSFKGSKQALSEKLKNAKEFREKAGTTGLNRFNLLKRHAFKNTEEGREAYNKKRDADKAFHAKTKNILSSLAGVGIGTASSAMRSVSKSTNGFGLNGLKEDLKSIGANAVESATAVDAKRMKHQNNSQNRAEFYENLRQRWQAYQDKRIADKELMKLQIELKNTTDSARRDEINARINALNDKKASIQTQIDSINDDIKDSAKNLMTAETGLKILVNVKSTFSPDQSIALKAKQELFSVTEQNENELKQTGQTFVLKGGSNIRLQKEVNVEVIEKICGANTESSKVVQDLIEGMNYRDMQGELDSLASSDDQKFIDHLKNKGLLEEIPPKIALGSFSFSSEEELRQHILNAMADPDTIMEGFDKSSIKNMKDLSVDELVSECAKYGIHLDPIIRPETTYKLNGESVQIGDLARLKASISGAIGGLKSEFEKRTIDQAADAISGSVDLSKVFIDTDAAATFIGKSDGQEFAAAIEKTNAGYRQAYPGSRPENAEARKEIKDRAKSEIIELRKKTAVAQNRQSINKIKNPGSKK